MDPLTIGIAAVGLGMQLFGGAGQASAAKQSAQISQQEASISQGELQDESQINAQKMQQTQIQAQRMQLENVRNVQRQRAQATAAAVNQGAQFGSGLAGGLGQISDEGTFNALGINQNLNFANNIFGITNDITNKKSQIAGLQGQQAAIQGQAATDQGIASLGGALVKSSGTIGAFGSNAFAGLKGLNLGSGLMGGGSPSGYGT